VPTRDGRQGPLPGRRASFPNVMASLLRRDRCKDVHWHPATRAVVNHIDQRTASRQALSSQNFRGPAPERLTASPSRIPDAFRGVSFAGVTHPPTPLPSRPPSLPGFISPALCPRARSRRPWRPSTREAGAAFQRKTDAPLITCGGEQVDRPGGEQDAALRGAGPPQQRSCVEAGMDYLDCQWSISEADVESMLSDE
jgi:hypothetical protein